MEKEMLSTLNLIISREEEIKQFVEINYYDIVGKFGIDGNLKAHWIVTEKSNLVNPTQLYNNGFRDMKNAQKFISSLKEKKAKVIKSETLKYKEVAPFLYNLYEIQNDCIRKFNLKPDKTIDILLNLYYKGFITYPLTDARVLSTTVAKTIHKNLCDIKAYCREKEIYKYFKKIEDKKYYTNFINTRYVNDDKITDYCAIIPVGKGFIPYTKLSNLDKQIYELIVKRFLAIFFPPVEFTKICATLMIENEQFELKEEIYNKLEFLELLGRKVNTNIDILKWLKLGNEIDVNSFQIDKLAILPPKIYNSGSIILAMEKAKIGKSNTRVKTVSKLKKLGYIDIDEQTQIIKSTKQGKRIYDKCKKVIS